MALFLLAVLAFLVGSLWWFALHAAFRADSKQRRQAKQLLEEIEGWFKSGAA